MIGDITAPISANYKQALRSEKILSLGSQREFSSSVFICSYRPVKQAQFTSRRVAVALPRQVGTCNMILNGRRENREADGRNPRAIKVLLCHR